ncbi:N-acetylglucosamine-6-phosphate deacetylase [Micrococcus luteus]
MQEHTPTTAPGAQAAPLAGGGPRVSGDGVRVLRAAHVHDGDRFHDDGWVALDGDRILAVGSGRDTPWNGSAAVHDLGDVVLAPGLVDMHCHGAGGASFSAGAEAARAAAAMLRAHGTAAVMASLVSEPVPVLAEQVRALVPLVSEGVLAGIHLEGPWLASVHRGAHDAAALCAPTPADVDRLLAAAGGVPLMVTLAPELPGALEAVRGLTEAGAVVGVGHTAADYGRTVEAICAGASVATHLYNGCRAPTHRDPGPVPALLEGARAGSVTIETIADGVHLHPAVLRRTAAEAGRRWAVVSDSMAAACCPDGDYRLGPVAVTVAGGVARTVASDGRPGAIAGSTATLADCLAHAVAAGIGPEQALRAATSVPADALGLPLGRLCPGGRADLAVFAADLRSVHDAATASE